MDMAILITTHLMDANLLITQLLARVEQYIIQEILIPTSLNTVPLLTTLPKRMVV